MTMQSSSQRLPLGRTDLAGNIRVSRKRPGQRPNSAKLVNQLLAEQKGNPNNDCPDRRMNEDDAASLRSNVFM